LTVAVNGDTRVEANESFFVDLSGAVGATIDDSEGEAAVQNDDSTTVSIGDVSVAEGDTGTVDAVLTVTLSNESALPVTVDFATRDGTATIADGDYQAAAGTLTFDPNEISQTVSVAVNGDLTVEPGESFFVDLSSAAGATIADGEGEATIQNDDGTVLSIGDASVLEKDEGGRTAIVPVVLSAPSALLVTVDFATRDGSATLAGDDYRAQAGELRFAPGVTRRDLRILVIGDTAVEPDERFFIDLESPAGAGLGDAEGVVTIRNDDRAPGVLRLAAAPSVAEGAGSATITVERTGGASGEATVEFETADGTALAGEDYQSAAGTLRWGDGESGSRSFVVELLDDNIGEDDETVAIRLTNPSGAALGAADETELTIVDDDQAARLEALGETEINSKVGRQIELQALATREDGSPVQGAEVVWTVEGDATLVGEGSTRTDADGVATQLIELGGSPGPVTVTAQIGSTGQTVSFEIVVAGNLDELFDPLLNPAEASVAMALNEACLDAQQAFAELCDYLFGLDPADQRDLITELTPFEAGALADLLLRSPTVQLLNLRRHLVARRGGGGTGSQITLGIGGQSVPLDVLRMAFSGEAEVVQRMAARIDAAMFQQEEEEAAADSAPAVDAEGSRFSFFASGQVDVGDRPGSEREAGYDLDTLGLTIGLDYRVGPRFILGGALGYVDTETKTVRDGGGIDVRGYGLSGFATYFRDKLWLDGILSYSWTEYDFLRNIDLPQPFLGQSRLAARGQPEGSQIAVDVGAGYDTSFGATSLSGFGRLSYIDAELDAFTERGAGPFNLALRGQQIESLLFEAGLELAWVSSRSWGVLQPVLRASALHEFEDDSREIVAGFAADVGGNLFRLPTDRPDRDFFRLGTGLTATLARGRALYLLYETDLEREDLDLYRLSAGLRLEF
jgi:outer membrane autotransporter protein